MGIYVGETIVENRRDVEPDEMRDRRKRATAIASALGMDKQRKSDGGKAPGRTAG